MLPQYWTKRDIQTPLVGNHRRTRNSTPRLRRSRSRSWAYESLEQRLCLASYSIAELAPLPGSSLSVPTEINDSRAIVGYSTAPDLSHPALGHTVAAVVWPALGPCPRFCQD